MSACSLADYIEKSSQQSALDKYIYFLCIYICNMGTHTITRAGTRSDRFCFIYLCVYICLCDKYIYQVQAEVVASGEPKSMKMPRLLLHCCCFYYYSCHCCFFFISFIPQKVRFAGENQQLHTLNETESPFTRSIDLCCSICLVGHFDYSSWWNSLGTFILEY